MGGNNPLGIKLGLYGVEIVHEKYRERYRLLGLRIAYYRKRKGYTQEQFAELIGKRWSFISQVAVSYTHLDTRTWDIILSGIWGKIYENILLGSPGVVNQNLT